MLRHVAWFNKALIEPNVGGGLRSDEPRVVRRCLAPARRLEELGVECSVFGHMHHADPAHVCQHLQSLETDIVVIGGLDRDSRLQLARAAKHLGCYVVVDLEDGADASEISHFLAIADQLVVGAEAEAMRMEALGFPVLLIPDCDGQDEFSSQETAEQWLDCFKRLKMKPPACANANTPTAANS